ncbi:hypothetical protein [Brevundimonas sp. LM2]|uniref:hypothetical protein n=1 Tax=Brevundimonas sp. LM2 TaxID=1938605 RepID=UPI0012379544|nr:hypothetical protein [Brevundimonas sp. LM2]
MTDTNPISNEPTSPTEDTGHGASRPDKTNAPQPAQSPSKPATGGEGAAGAGGSDGFGTGS